jgi:hypothetical protein
VLILDEVRTSIVCDEKKHEDLAALKVMGNVLGLLQYSTEVFFDRQENRRLQPGD